MHKQLKDGERKVIRPSRNFSMFKHNLFLVEAERVDCDTPGIHLTVASGTIVLTDTQAADLIERLQRALSILPTSK